MILKTKQQKKKLLMMSNFPFCHNLFKFSIIKLLFIIAFPYFWLKCFQSRLLQICFLWKRVKGRFSKDLFLWPVVLFFFYNSTHDICICWSVLLLLNILNWLIVFFFVSHCIQILSAAVMSSWEKRDVITIIGLEDNNSLILLRVVFHFFHIKGSAKPSLAFKVVGQ